MLLSSSPAVPAGLTDIARVQDFVVTRRQLARVGVGRHQVEANVAGRRWQVFGSRAVVLHNAELVVLHNAELTVQQRRWLSVLWLDQPVALAGPTAAEQAGLRGFADEDLVHVVVDRSCSAALPRWVKVHNSRRFSPGDINDVASPPRTRAARSVVDTAAWSSRPRRACAVLCAAVQQRLAFAENLAAELALAGQVRHVAIMRAVLGDIGGGGHTLSELDLGPLAVSAGLPPPRRQALRAEPGGRIRYVDAEFDLPDGEVLVVEVDGAVHLNPINWWDDQGRQNEFVIAGDRVLRFDSVTMRLDPSRVVDQLRRMGRAHGIGRGAGVVTDMSGCGRLGR